MNIGDIIKADADPTSIYQKTVDGWEKVDVIRDAQSGQLRYRDVVAGGWKTVPVPQMGEDQLTGPAWDAVKTFNNFSRRVGNAATFEVGDEAAAATRAGIKALTNMAQGQDANFGSNYERYRDEANARDREWSQANPNASLAADIVGGAATGGSIAQGTVAKSGSLLGQTLKGAGTGAAIGSATGAGAADPSLGESRAIGALTGAATGATIGTLVPPAAAAAGAAAKAVASRLPKGAETVAKGRLADALGIDGMTGNRAAARMNTLGPDAVVADLGPAMARQTRVAVAVSPDGEAKAANLLNQRQATQNQRLTEGGRVGLGVDKGYFDATDELLKLRSRDAGPLYDNAYAVDLPRSQVLDELLSRPSVKEGWQKAKRMAADEGVELPEVFIQNADGSLSLNTKVVPDVRAWDYIKRGLDDVVDANRNEYGGLTNVGRVANNLARSIVDELDKLTEVNGQSLYKLARDSWAGPSRSLDAMKIGRAFLREDAEVTAQEVKNLSPAELEFFRIGVFQALKSRIGASKVQTNVASMLKDVPNTLEKLKVAFPDKQSFDRFRALMERESLFSGTKNAALVGSRTAPLQADMKAISNPSLVADVAAASHGSPGGVLALADRLAQRFNAPPEKVANEMLRILLSRDPSLIDPIATRIAPARMMGDRLRAGTLGTLASESEKDRVQKGLLAVPEVVSGFLGGR